MPRPPLTHIPELFNSSDMGTSPLPWAAYPGHQITTCPKNPTKPKPQNTEVAWSKAVVLSPFPTKKKHTQIPGKHKGAGEMNSHLRGLEALHLALLMVGLCLQGPFQPKWSYESIIWAKDNCHGFGCPRAALGQHQDLADQPVQSSVPKDGQLQDSNSSTKSRTFWGYQLFQRTQGEKS